MTVTERRADCNLEYSWNFSGVCSVHIRLSDRSNMKQLTKDGDKKNNEPITHHCKDIYLNIF